MYFSFGFKSDSSLLCLKQISTNTAYTERNMKLITILHSVMKLCYDNICNNRFVYDINTCQRQ
jgi:hypothetical protein